MYLNQKEIDESLKICQDEFNENSILKQQTVSIYLNNLQFTWPNRIQTKQDFEKQIDEKNDIQIKLLDNNDDQINQDFKLIIDNLIINKGTLNIIVGQIGCGKSAFLQSILNEMDCQINNNVNQGQKQIIVNGNIAYVSQNHWLQTKTIRENILFGKDFEQEWYDQCVEVCDLQIDFGYFWKKDQKVIASGGSNLSGGQRQRIAICRAIYSKKDIYLFDDIFSSLDAHVVEKIFEKAIIGLLIQKLRKTVIFVTSHYGVIKFDIYLQYFKSMNYFIFFLYLLFIAFNHVVQFFIDFWLRDYVSKDQNSYFYEFMNRFFNYNFEETFLFQIYLILLINVFNCLFYFLSSILSCQSIFKKLNKSIIYSKMSFFDKNPVGRIVCRISNDVGQVDHDIPFSFHETLNQFMIVQYFKNDLEKPEEVLQGNLEENELNIEEKSGNYDIIFKDLYITYDQVTNIDKNQKDIQFALKNINLKIKKGEKIAFCGRTGSGKTSILNIIFNLYPFQFGSIFIDGKNIKQYSIKELRSKMSIIPQFGFLYNSSLKDNLDPDSFFSKEDVEQKINQTNLKLNIQNEQQQEINDNQKIDLDYKVENGGNNLSNGQKQIINFLRIILRDTDIICLDEATSNMDPQTDQELHDQLFKLAENKTLLVITHRLENIDKFDRVVVLDNGSIVECGHVSQLRQIKDGFFNRLLKH
ncbi:hypothetical protein IMG5_072110 [Ichthyophthirius multifiliis]|uniref:ABC transporter domain-containing protein n=2 Tax=Ichthyophthirius multifiliis TaxID=5932 RepID=G0QPX1_ICHMU|nr:hypothetical protein IMG5_072110 [Ichthyophthirius multifiliis]EGR32733.1 hypothetical protein IMG5_072110 [Ichthyophthirius multifiliis]|eukprot:XP_004036719.1 hypothetical protein IMG5_072110 [Ichthyophthirius multifiliis]